MSAAAMSPLTTGLAPHSLLFIAAGGGFLLRVLLNNKYSAMRSKRSFDAAGYLQRWVAHGRSWNR